MCDDYHSSVLLGKAADDLEHLAGKLRVESARRLVKAENVRFERESARDRDALLLAAGELMRVIACAVGKPHLAEKLHAAVVDTLYYRLGIGLVCLAVPGLKLRREGHVLKRGVLREEIEALEYEPKVQAVFPDLRVGELFLGAVVKQDMLAGLGVHGDPAGARHFKEVQAAQHSGLAAAGGADDAQRLALIEGEADALEDVQRIKALFQVFNFKYCHGTPPYLK